MALPVMKTPQYSMVIPSTKKEVQFRPFLVKEEKALLLAQQSDDQNVMLNTLKEIIKSCVINEIDINSLALFDYEYMFTQIRCKSVGEKTDLILRCDTCTDEKAKSIVSVDLTKCEVTIPENYDKKIVLFEDVGVVMKYPGIDTLSKIDKMNNGDLESIFEVLADCLDYIYDSSQVYHAKEQSAEELKTFIENLTQEQFKKIEAFFLNLPVLKQDIEYTCPVCAKEHKKTIQGIESFF